MNAKDFRLKELREKHEYTQQEVADMLGVKRGTYASWECGNDIISTKQIYNLANIYNVSIDYIVNLNDKNISILNKNNLDLDKIGLRLKEIRKKQNYHS